MKNLILSGLKTILFVLQLVLVNLIIKIAYGRGAGCGFRCDKDTSTFEVDFICDGTQHRYTITLFNDTDSMSVHHGSKDHPIQHYITEDCTVDVGIQLIKEDLEERGIIRRKG